MSKTKATLEVERRPMSPTTQPENDQFPFARLDERVSIIDIPPSGNYDASENNSRLCGAEICIVMALNFREYSVCQPQPHHSPAERKEMSDTKASLIIANLALKRQLAQKLEAGDVQDRDQMTINWIAEASSEIKRFKERIFLTKSINGISREMLAGRYLLEIFGRDTLRSSNLDQDRMQATDFLLRHPDGITLRIDAKSSSSLLPMIDKKQLLLPGSDKFSDTGIPVWAIRKKSLKLLGGMEPSEIPLLYICPDALTRPLTKKVYLPNQTIHFSTFDSPLHAETMAQIEEGCNQAVTYHSPKFMTLPPIALT